MQIRVSVGDVRWLSENWTTQWQRAPTEEELRGLIADYVNEQLLAREARALGLEDNDVIVRRRLAQKMDFLIADISGTAEPSDAELDRYYATHAERFAEPARMAFTQIYFGPRRTDAVSDAKSALALLLEEGTPENPDALGDRLMIGREFDNETEFSVSSEFGPAFARAVFALEPGAWYGPIESGYGVHLVRVSARTESRTPPLSEVRIRVIEDWTREQERSAKARYLYELRSKYEVVADAEVRDLVTALAHTGRTRE
jgi:hypothetical protein